MLTSLGSRQFRRTLGLLRLLFASALFVASITPLQVSAQSGDDPWSEPLNLSHSGVTKNPDIVVDSEGVVHSVWQDDIGNYWYAQFDGNQWSTPERTDLNRLFGFPGAEDRPDPDQLANHTGPNPLFIAVPDQHIFASWILPDGRVFTSRVENQRFNGAWEANRLITTGAASFAATVDAGGEAHLAFIRTADDPANPPGVYYTRSKNSGTSWTIPVLLYDSPYFRRLGEGEANLSIATVGADDTLRVFIAWDNRPRKQLFLAQSADGGESWTEPVLVAGPAPNSELAGPFNVRVGTFQNSVVLVWQNGEPDVTCTQLYKSSQDAGRTWSEPQPMLDDQSGCAQSNEFLTGLGNSREGLLYLLSKTKSQVFLTAWNGRQLSEPKAQPLLAGFEEPEIYTHVVYGCQRGSLSGKRLYIIGCDDGGGGDVWVTSRDLGTNSSWFSPPAWSQPLPVTSENPEMAAVEIVATSDNLIHAFFSQRDGPAIYHTYWDGELWSRIIPVLEVPEGETGQPAIATGAENELFLFAPNNRGSLYFSRAISESAAIPSRWSTPTRLELRHEGEIGSIDVAWSAAGSLYVAYSVPLNEERGIYLVKSTDNGLSWSEPLQVFNGATAGFSFVGSPTMLTLDNGVLHILWKEQAIRGDEAPQTLSLYYARSEDGGQTFSDPELLLEEPVAWQEMLTDSKGELHLLWQGQNTMNTVWDQVSLDGGRSWQPPHGLQVDGMTVAKTVDSAGQIHVVNAGTGSLGHWLWNGSLWEPQAPLHWPLPSQQEGSMKLLSASANKQGRMVVVLAVSMGDADAVEQRLLYSTHMLALPRESTTVPEVSSKTPSPPTPTQATPTLESSPTPAITVTSIPTSSQWTLDRNQTSNRTSSIAIVLIPVALLLLSVLGVVIRRATRAGDR